MSKSEINNWKLILIACSIIVLVIMGVRNCFGLFLEPIASFNNSGTEPFSIGMSIQAIMWGISAFLLGMIIDKFGPQKALAFGILCYALGLYLLSDAHSFFVTIDYKYSIIFGFGTLTGIGLGAGGMSTVVAIIGKTAPLEKKSVAMGYVAAAGSFGQFIFIAPTLFSIETFGWQKTILLLSFVILLHLILIPLLNEKNKKSSKKELSHSEFNIKEVIKFSLKDTFFCKNII